MKRKVSVTINLLNDFQILFEKLLIERTVAEPEKSEPIIQTTLRFKYLLGKSLTNI